MLESLTQPEKDALKRIQQSITRLHGRIMTRISPQDDCASKPFNEVGRHLLFNVLDAWGDGSVEPALEMVLAIRHSLRESLLKAFKEVPKKSEEEFPTFLCPKCSQELLYQNTAGKDAPFSELHHFRCRECGKDFRKDEIVVAMCQKINLLS